jgi:aspartate racemase
MGPESTAALFLEVIRTTPVSKEQDHLRILIDNNPKVPDRTEVLLSGRTEPAISALTETARNLERAGAELIGMPCNTAHAFLAEIRASVTVPVLDMIDETARRARQIWGSDSVIGLLATDGTHLAGIYHEALDLYGLKVVAPREQSQRAVMDVIGIVKRDGVSGRCHHELEAAVRDCADQGALAVIAGCTEISLVMSEHPPDLEWLDPVTVLADALVREAIG